MKLRSLSRTALPLLLAFCLTAAALPAPPASAQNDDAAPAKESFDTREFVPGEVLVQFRHSAPEARIAVGASASVMTVDAVGSGQLPMRVENKKGLQIIEGLRLAHVGPKDTLRAVAALNARPDVEFAQPNYIYKTEAIPNDPLFPQMYNLRNTGQDANSGGGNGTADADIDADQAWDLTTGSSSVVIGIIDTGIDINHPDLAANIWTNPGEVLDGADNDGNGRIDDINGWDFGNNDRTVFDSASIDAHGTHVAGTIGAVGNNGIGVTGINWQVKLMALKFIDTAAGGGGTDDAIAAMDYALDMKNRGINIRVINNSWGGRGDDPFLTTAITRLNNAGILFVAAAGNDGVDNDDFPHSPAAANVPNVVAVARTNHFDNRSFSSNFGARTVHVGAPGFSILSTVPNGQYAFFGGTSMASPHVTGVAGLILARNPGISMARLKAALIYSGDPVPGGSEVFSLRRLNAYRALINSDETDGIAPAISGLSSSVNGRSLILQFQAGDDGLSGTPALLAFTFYAANGQKYNIASRIPADSAHNISVEMPYHHTSGTLALRVIDDAGNEAARSISVTISAAASEPYTMTLGAGGGLSTGGTPLNFNNTTNVAPEGADDAYVRDFNIGFNFPFFGRTKTTVTVSTNGTLYFSPPPLRTSFTHADDAVPTTAELSMQEMIAALWADNDMRSCFRPGADVYVVRPNASSVIFRWQGVRFTSDNCPASPTGNPVNFEAELRGDGTIITRYGDGNVGIRPVVGISGGQADTATTGSDAYVATTHTNTAANISLTNAASVIFTPRPSGAAPTVQLSAAATSVSEGAGSVTVNVTRSDASAAGSVEYATGGGTADSAKDYTLLLGRLDFAAGETTKPLTVLLTDDVFAEGSETLQLTLSNAAGMALGTLSSTIITINDNDGVTGLSPVRSEAFNAGFFVRQHYLDFFSREPDAGGLAHWTNIVNNCGDPDLLVCRINVSAAFFLSIEFEQTGYLVERAYKAAYGDATGNSTLGGTPHTLTVPVIRFEEFLPDTQRIGRGVVVLAPGWEELLEANKTAYFLEFVQRSRFTTAYPAGMTPTAFVDQLNARAGNPLDAAERQSLINELTAGNTTAGRASVLRKVSEDATLFQAERNRAFVLMQYFGYLRRNPNGGQDTDYTGYEFWLTNLDKFNGNFVQAELVKAFIVSDEYQKRFGN